MKIFHRLKKLRKYIGLDDIRATKAMLAYQLQVERYAKFANDNYGVHPDFPLKSFSQNDEDGYVELYTDLFDIGSDHHFLEIGVGDGSQNNTLYLLFGGWSGTWIDVNQPSYIPVKKNLEVITQSISKANAVSLLKSTSVGHKASSDKLGFLSIDIDGVDFEVLRSLLTVVSPKLICCEVNGQFGPSISWVYDGEPMNPNRLTWNFGMSFRAAVDLLKEHSYRPLALNAGTGLNLFAVRNDLISDRNMPEAKFIPPLYTSYDQLYPKKYSGLYHK